MTSIRRYIRISSQERRAIPKTTIASTVLAISLLPSTLYADAKGDFDQAFSQYQAYRFEEAREGFEAFLERYPEHPQVPVAVYRLAELEWSPGKALTYYQRILSRYPGSAVADSALFRVGQYQFASGDFAKAGEAFTELLKRYPRSKVIYGAKYWLGISCFARGDRISAIGELKEVVERAPHTQYGALAKNDLERIEKGLTAPPGREGTEEVSGEGPYLIQVGSFTDLQAAVRLRRKLEEKGYPVSFNEAVVRDKTFYRVRVGPYLTKEEARVMGKRLADEEGLPCWIVKRRL